MRPRAPRFVYALAALALGGVALFGLTVGWEHERTLVFTRGTGWLAVGLLLAALSLSPIGAIARRAGRPIEVGPTRRALGITSAAVACVHAGLASSTQLSLRIAPILELAWLRAGALALAILLALWLTSYPRVTRALRIAHWKPLHRLAYIAALLALHHMLGAPLAPRAFVLAIFGAALLLGLARLLPRRRADPAPGPSEEDQRNATESQAISHSES